MGLCLSKLKKPKIYVFTAPRKFNLVALISIIVTGRLCFLVAYM